MADQDSLVLQANSPPQVYIEPPVPDPFLVDDHDSSEEEENDRTTEGLASESQQTIIPPPTPTDTPSSPAVTSNNDVLASESSSEEQEDAPEIYLPGLVIPTMFLPIPNTDPLTTLLTKYISPPEKRPVRDVSGEWQRSDFHTLVMTNSWRALARMARDKLVTADPQELNLVLSLWYVRLACLARLRLFNQTSAECTNLFTVLLSTEPPAARAYLFDHLVPFELEVMQTRVKYWTGDMMGYVDALAGLLGKCKRRAREEGRRARARRKKSAVGEGEKVEEPDVAMWIERGARVCLMLASQFIEMKDFSAAIRLLEPLCSQPSSSALHAALARICLQAGYLPLAEKHLSLVHADSTAEPYLRDTNEALLCAAKGDWAKSEVILKKLLAEDEGNCVAVNNLGVALLSQGRLKEAVSILEKALQTYPSTVVVEPFLFNLSTLYELRSGSALDKKRELLIEVAKWSGDGLKTACLKMPTT